MDKCPKCGTDLTNFLNGTQVWGTCLYCFKGIKYLIETYVPVEVKDVGILHSESRSQDEKEGHGGSVHEDSKESGQKRSRGSVERPEERQRS